MVPQAKCFFAKAPRGFLLVEAILTAVVIGTGLVFISRALAGNVKQLSTIQQYDRLLQLAASTLAVQEAQAQQAPPLALLQRPERAGQAPPLTTLTGEYEPPDVAYQWTLETHPREVEGLAPQMMEDVTITVSRRDDRPPVVRLRTVWPVAWIRSE